MREKRVRAILCKIKESCSAEASQGAVNSRQAVHMENTPRYFFKESSRISRCRLWSKAGADFQGGFDASQLAGMTQLRVPAQEDVQSCDCAQNGERVLRTGGTWECECGCVCS